MTDLPQQRPVKAVREQVIERLTLNYAHNNLDDEEFEERLSRATNAETANELMMLVSDLPEIAETKRLASSPLADLEVALNTGEVKDEGALVAILGGSSRKGWWQPPRHLHVLSVLGGVELDFTQAEMAPGTTEVTVFALMGGVDITVPPGLNVDVTGIPFMGGFDDKSAGMIDPKAPTLKVRGVAIMGGVDVKVPRKFRRMLNDLRRAREQRTPRHRNHSEDNGRPS